MARVALLVKRRRWRSSGWTSRTNGNKSVIAGTESLLAVTHASQGALSNDVTISIRHATAEDQAQILSLARGERIKPTGLDWPKFVVAVSEGKIVGAVQLRSHPDGSRELGSLVVAPPFRGRGVAAQLIEKRLADTTGRVLVITGRAHADYYGRWDFRRIRPISAPPFVCLNYWLGYLGGGLIAVLRGRAVNHLAVFER